MTGRGEHSKDVALPPLSTEEVTIELLRSIDARLANVEKCIHTQDKRGYDAHFLLTGGKNE